MAFCFQSIKLMRHVAVNMVTDRHNNYPLCIHQELIIEQNLIILAQNFCHNEPQIIEA